MVAKGTLTWLLQTIFGLFVVILMLYSQTASCKKKKEENPDDKWKKKDITDYNDADLERLYEQWEEDDEPLPEDELPEWKRPQPKIDLSALDPNDPEGMLKMTKKGKTVMLFATVAGNPDEKETETTSMLWQSSLHNANVDVQRYVVGSDRVLFVVRDGALAWAARDFLVKQENCELVTIEGKDYHNEKRNKNSNSSMKKKDDITSNKASQKKADPSSKKASKTKEDKKKKLEDKKRKENIENEIKRNLNEKTEL